MSDNLFQELVKTFHEPLPEILRSLGDTLDIPSRDLSADNQEDCDGPGHDHRVRHWECSDMKKRNCVEWQSAVLLVSIAVGLRWSSLRRMPSRIRRRVGGNSSQRQDRKNNHRQQNPKNLHLLKSSISWE